MTPLPEEDPTKRAKKSRIQISMRPAAGTMHYSDAPGQPLGIQSVPRLRGVVEQRLIDLYVRTG